MLIVWGRNDMLVPVADAARYEHLIGDNAHARSSTTRGTWRCSSARALQPSCSRAS